jgi:DNA-binding IclR family transcriptional regulator
VTVARKPRQHGRTVPELAQRWRMSEETTREFLEAFARTGYARRRGEFWFATPKATRIVGFGPEGEQ